MSHPRSWRAPRLSFEEAETEVGEEAERVLKTLSATPRPFRNPFSFPKSWVKKVTILSDSRNGGSGSRWHSSGKEA